MSEPSASWIRGFEAPAGLEEAGGKGLNLARLARAGFDVPDGFVLTTGAYRAFVAGHGLGPVIEAALATLAPEAADAAALEAASARIREAFRAGRLDPDTAAQVAAGYDALGGAVAVRSSATAEDLPEASFAGQQDTFLDVVGADAVAAVIIECWSSLWTARAIGYRAARGVPHADAAVAVVVQRLVAADCSGVMFTADPLTGHRGRTAIDATHGLGEALVSGRVEPDRYVVDSRSGTILSRALGSKAVVTLASGHGAQTRSRAPSTTPALDDAQVRELAGLGGRVQQLYGEPQDIEWALADDRFFLLQTRAITSLYPLPEQSDDDLAVWLSFGAVQGVLDPLTPLGQDAIGELIAGAAAVFGRDVGAADNPYLRAAGERLWFRVDGALRTRVGRAVLPRVLPVVEPSAARILTTLYDDPGLNHRGGPTLGGARALVAGVGALAPNVPRTWLTPARARERFQRATDDLVERTRRRLDEAGRAPDSRARLRARVEVARSELRGALPELLPRFAPIMGPLVIGLGLLRQAATASGDPRLETAVLEVTRSVPHNVTTQMDLALWAVAERIRADPPARRAFTDTAPQELAAAYRAGELPPAAQAGVSGFLDRYGMRGVGEIDLGRARWREDPEPVLATLRGYVALEDPSRAPDVLFRRGQQAAGAAVTRLATTAGRGRGGALKSRALAGLAGRARELIGLRETPKFTLVRILGHLRAALLASGADLAAKGLLEEAGDVIYLRLGELEGDPAPWRALVAQRRRVARREAARRQVPRVLLGDGRTFYEGLGASVGSSGLAGSPVSPGTAEGAVHVIHDPRTEHLRPGEILVCVGTDPAWTPLFLTAAGLVTEVGGLMTHGSVVAREYGIPAVVGVHEATTRLRSGQRVRLDGTTGVIETLEDT